ncbi:MAG: Thrombospondin type 3 repeat [Nocardioides sp.]|nr:Thrombospondin type 3 repeat [Nocardioides sp.]
MNARRLLLPVVALALAVLGTSSALGSPSESYVGPHFGNGHLPAGCLVDRDPINPDNHCYHMKVGLNALDSPKVDVDVLIPVSPAAERDMRVATQAVQMWDDGLHYLADQMGLPWLVKGFDMDVRTHEIPVDEAGQPRDPIHLVDPEIVVVVSNPAGGIGIGIDPTAFGSALGLYDDQGVPCTQVPDPFSMSSWQAREGFDQHDDEPGGTYVQDCGGVGGNVCFAVNGAVDPATGASDFFPLFDLVSHEFGHCLTLGHVGDGADGPWGPTPTNDIMAYSTDPPLINKCVSTLDVEGFALRMSNYLDVNADGHVSHHDLLVPNDELGDGTSPFQVQNPADHHYASPTGDPADCPQADQSLVPGAEGDFLPKPVATTRQRLRLGEAAIADGRLHVHGSVTRVPLATQPTAFSARATDGAGDAYSPVTDLEGVHVKVTRTAVDAVIDATQVWPVVDGTSPVAYSLTIDGRRLDSFVPTGGTDDQPVVMDNGTGYYLPKGTATWDTTKNTVTFHVRRDYLADQSIRAPYNVYAVTGYHTRSNDWVANDDLAPDDLDLDLAAPKLGPETRDAPVANRVTSTSFTAGRGSFVPSDSTLGVGLISTVDSRDYVHLPITRQSSALVTLTWTGDATLGLTVGGGSSQQPVKTNGANVLQVLVPWARRDLTVTVDPQEVLDPTDYTLSVKHTTVIADRDGDHVPDVADNCPGARGPSAGGGCPDSDHDTIFDVGDACPSVPGIGADGCPTGRGERVVALLDGERVDATSVVTLHGGSQFGLSAPVSRGSHLLEVRWYDGNTLVASARRTLG